MKSALKYYAGTLFILLGLPAVILVLLFLFFGSGSYYFGPFLPLSLFIVLFAEAKKIFLPFVLIAFAVDTVGLIKKKPSTAALVQLFKSEKKVA